MLELIHKYPRLYINAAMRENAKIFLSSDQAHYLKNVLRKQSNDIVRIFNGQDGEWLAGIDTLKKKDATLFVTEKIKDQPASLVPIHLLFSPLKKKQRMDMLIEKAVELGVNGLYPILMNRAKSVHSMKTVCAHKSSKRRNNANGLMYRF